MHRCLRYLFVSMLLIVLPLRGWAGHSMAIDMVSGRTTAAAAALVVQGVAPWTANQMSMGSPMPADCAMHSQPLTEDAAPYCSSCDTCELCLAVTSLAQVQWAASYAPLSSSPSTFDLSYSSAVKMSDLKPPIS